MMNANDDMPADDHRPDDDGADAGEYDESETVRAGHSAAQDDDDDPDMNDLSDQEQPSDRQTDNVDKLARNRENRGADTDEMGDDPTVGSTRAVP